MKARAKAHRRSVEAEFKAILERELAPPDALNVGEALLALGRELGGVELATERSPEPTATPSLSSTRG